MLLSGCKGNTFFWKNTFFYGLICVQSEKTQKTAWFHQLTDSINEGSETEKTSVFFSNKEQNSRNFYPKIHPLRHCFRYNIHRLSYPS